jgi:hypothetical protein
MINPEVRKNIGDSYLRFAKLKKRNLTEPIKESTFSIKTERTLQLNKTSFVASKAISSKDRFLPAKTKVTLSLKKPLSSIREKIPDHQKENTNKQGQTKLQSCLIDNSHGKGFSVDQLINMNRRKLQMLKSLVNLHS